VVGISGGSYSGKKTFCRGLKRLLDTNATVFLSEALYQRDFLLERDAEGFSVDVPVFHPGAFDSSLLLHHIEELAAGSPIFVPHYDWEQGIRGTTWQVLTPAPIIIVEGEFLFEDAALLNRLDFKVFIDAPLPVRAERLMAFEAAYKNLPQGWGVHEVVERLLANHEQYVEPRRRLADSVISGEMPFEAPLIDLGARVLDEVFARRRR
jgi:uridine kinase